MGCFRLASAACVELGKGQVVEDTLDAPYALGNHADGISLTLRGDRSRYMHQTVGDGKGQLTSFDACVFSQPCKDAATDRVITGRRSVECRCDENT